MHFFNHVDTENGPPLPPPNNVGMKKRFRDRLKCARTTTLLGGVGSGGKVQKGRDIMLFVLRLLSPIVAIFMVEMSSNYLKFMVFPL